MPDLLGKPISNFVKTEIPLSPRYRAVLGGGFCLLAYLGNLNNFDMFFGVNFLFGSIFVWLSLIALGPIWSIFVAIIGALYTVELWGHWFAFILFTSEAVFVAVFTRFTSATRISFLVIVYWLGIGVPGAIFLYGQVLDLPWATTLLVASKQTLNGLLNAMIASLVVTSILFFRPKVEVQKTFKETNSYSGLLQAIFGLAFLLPFLISEFIELQADFKRGIAFELAQSEIDAGHSKNTVEALLRSETVFWGTNLARVTVDERENKVKELLGERVLVAPQQIFTDNNDGTQQLIFGPKAESRHILRPVSTVNSNKQKQIGLLLGCRAGRLVSVYFSGTSAETFTFVWPEAATDQNVFFGNDAQTKSSCVSDPEKAMDESPYNTSAEVLRDRDPSVPALRSWLGASIQVKAPLEAVYPSALELTRPLKTKILLVQDDTSSAIIRLCILATLVVLGGQILDILFRRWVKKFTRISEAYLKNREHTGNSLNMNFAEDRIIYMWLERFSNVLTSEGKRKRQAQKNFGFLLDKSLTPVFATNPEGLVRVWNPALQKITGYTELETLGHPISNFLKQTPESSSAFGTQSASKRVFDVKTKNGNFVHIVVSKLGAEFEETSSLGVHDNEFHQTGPISYFIAQNLSALKENQAKLIHSSRLAALGEMASSFAHELNQPLNVIALAAGSLTERAKLEKVPQSYLISKAQRIEAQAIRAGKVIQGIRNFTLEIGDEKSIQFDPVQRTSAAIELMREQFRLESISVKVCPPPTQVNVLGRPILFEQAMVNLLANAKQAMEEQPLHKREIKVSFTSDNKEVVISVYDTGSGIDDANLLRIFDPFFSTKKDKGGTGVGLYMCRSVVEELGGKIEALKVAHGACLKIRLPRALETWET